MRNDIQYIPTKNEIINNHFRIYRLKVKKHSNKRMKKSFYKTRFWELHFRGHCNSKRFLKKSNRIYENKIKSLSNNNINFLSIHKSIFSFHNGDSGINCSFINKDNKLIFQKKYRTMPDESELKIEAILHGYDDVIISHNTQIIIE